MGWTGKAYNKSEHTNWNYELAAEFIQSEIQYSGLSLECAYVHFAKDEYDHNEIYAVMDHHKIGKVIVVCIVDIKDGEIFWKEMSESMGPTYHNCPIEFLELAEIPDGSKYAIDWRRTVEQRNIKLAGKQYLAINP